MSDENLGKLEDSLLSKRHYCLPQSEPSLPDIPITQKKLEILILCKIFHFRNVTSNFKRKKKAPLAKQNTIVDLIQHHFNLYHCCRENS